MKLSTLAAALAVGLFVTGAAYAQSPSPTGQPSPTATPVSPKPDEAARAAKSADCDKQADAQDLRGKPRRKFHAKCMKAM